MKSKVSAQISTKGTYLGYFEAEKHTTNVNNDKPSRSYERLTFIRADGIERRDLISMGDIVYGMYVDNKLVKVGKAGGFHALPVRRADLIKRIKTQRSKVVSMIQGCTFYE